MKTIRRKVFETNSSSSHSISIDKTTKLFKSITPKNGVIKLEGGTFGWEWMKYNDPLTKANYCATGTKYNNYGNLKDELLIAVISEHTGAKEVQISLGEDAHIDHQSIDIVDDAFESAEALKNFIFNPKSVLRTGNDNGAAPPNFYDDDTSHFTHEMTLEGTNMVCYVNGDIEDDKEKMLAVLYSLFEINIYNSDPEQYSICTYDHKLRETVNPVDKKAKTIKIYRIDRRSNTGNNEPEYKKLKYEIKPRAKKKTKSVKSSKQISKRKLPG